MHKFPAGYFVRVVCSGADGQEALGWQSLVGCVWGCHPQPRAVGEAGGRWEFASHPLGMPGGKGDRAGG